MNWSTVYVNLALRDLHLERTQLEAAFREQWYLSQEPARSPRRLLRWCGDRLVQLGERFRDWGAPGAPAHMSRW
jgi:hypothetical protein